MVYINPVAPVTAQAKTPETIEELISQYDWDKDLAYKIMSCESGGNPTVINDSPKTGDYSIGLFQINLYGDNAQDRPSEDWLKIPQNNIAYAYELYQKSGFKTHWTNCYNGKQVLVDNHTTIEKPLVDNEAEYRRLIILHHILQGMQTRLEETGTIEGFNL